jgi:prepilin-type N-terminal cleavage/methylation domain-containing protein
VARNSIPSEDQAVQSRKAYTLMEVLLVVAIIGIMAGIAVPTIMTMYANYKLTAASDAIRAGWVKARSHAVDEGRRYRFSIVPGKGNYRIAPDSAEYWGGTVPDQDPDNPALILEGVLPSPIRFAMANDSAAPSNEDDADSSYPVGEVDPGQWVGTGYFEADGSVQDDVEIRLDLDGARTLIVSLRSMTGIANVKYGPVEGQR